MKYLKLFESYKMIHFLKELDGIVKELGLDKTDYAIFGSGPLAIREIIEPTDLDIIVKKDKYPFDQNPKIIGNIEFTYDWPYVDDVNLLINDSEIINGHPFVSLEYVKIYKSKLNRSKDRIHLDKIKEYENRNKRT